MGRNNRQRRAEKARRRDHKHRPSEPLGPEPDRGPTNSGSTNFGPTNSGSTNFGSTNFGSTNFGPTNFGPTGFGPTHSGASFGSAGFASGSGSRSGSGSATGDLQQLLQSRARGFPPGTGREQFGRHGDDEQQQALDAQLARSVNAAFKAGWTPLDLYEFTRRRVDATAVAHLLDIAAAETARHSVDHIDPRWSGQLAQLGARSPSGAAGCVTWAREVGLAWPLAADQLVELLVQVCGLPIIEAMCTPPGSALSGTHRSAGIDDRILRRVRALLAKAESSEFEEEADALTAKAQQLMTEHSIEHTLAQARQPEREEPATRRVWLDNPYLVAKALLVSAVAGANHSRSIVSRHLGFVTLVGLDRDLDVVELLSTSLLVQATRAMTLAGSHTTRSGVSRTRSFRQSFLVAYANRIGERLHRSAASTEASADSAHGGALLPVLAARDRAVDYTMEQLFPDLVQRGVSVSNAAGWGAGRAAADLARLDIREPLTGSRAR
jgi:Protein of unknown function (DUF2786)/Pentapeptide repeats (8 copies)